jgi:S-DNA-T family DNA segregation ATPase FtsK/SpoIIIE
MARKNKTTTRPGTRKTRTETKIALWLARHPGLVATPPAIGTSLIELGPLTTGGIAGGLLAAGAGWYRAHPDSFTRIASPRMRAFRRRWTRYIGRSWRDSLDHCGLTVQHRRTGELLVPRLAKVESPTPSIDVLRVVIRKGQSLTTFRNAQEELASALGADVIGIEQAKPRVLTITLVHGNPFDDVVAPADIPGDVDEVDLTAIELGDTEYGQVWTEPLLGQHWLIAGATGSGKGSLLWNPLRAMGPAIRDGIVRVSAIDPKGGMETERGRPLFHRYATSADDEVEYDTDGDGAEDIDATLGLLYQFRDAMKERQELLRSEGKRKFTASTETPFEVLMIDELAMLTALGGRRATITAVNKLLAEILTQGRACGFAVIAYVQEPTKDIVPVRDLFTRRICLRVGSYNYVDIVLGDGARERGGLADEIPETGCEGIGYRTSEKSRQPIRVRAGYSDDEDIDDLVRLCTPHNPTDDGPALYAIPA